MVHSADEKPISISHKFTPNSISVRVLPCPRPLLHQVGKSPSASVSPRLFVRPFGPWFARSTKARVSTLKWPNEFRSHNFAAVVVVVVFLSPSANMDGGQLIGSILSGAGTKTMASIFDRNENGKKGGRQALQAG